MEEENSPITEEQAESIIRRMSEKGINVHTFFTDVIKSKDTTRTGNLDSTELGTPRITLRGIKELELFCRDVFKQNIWAEYFKKLGLIQTDSSLSKDALLLKLSVTSKKELSDLTPTERKKNRGMFGFGRKSEDIN